MQRLTLIKNNLKLSSTSNGNYVKSAYEYLDFDQFLNEKEREYRKKLRNFLETNLMPVMPKYLEKAEFPMDIAKQMVKVFPGILGGMHKGYGSAGYSQYLSYAIKMELSRADFSFATFCLVHGGEVTMRALYMLGSEEQKSYYIPKLNSLELIGAFLVTEENAGSDAHGIITSASEDNDKNYIINGTKRWPGPVPADIYIVWARNDKSSEIEAYLVEGSRQGVSSKKIEGKGSLRSFQNGEIYFKNVKIPLKNKLEKANKFINNVNEIFLGSRIGCGWAVAGMCIGAYDKVIEYVSNRSQFGKSLSSFQLIQEKLARIMGNIHSIVWYSKRISERYQQGKATVDEASLIKAWCTKIGRKTVALARDMLGANGLLYEHYVMKVFVDMEAINTGDGTYDINMLIAARKLTGKFAIF